LGNTIPNTFTAAGYISYLIRKIIHFFKLTGLHL
jgi:hypothetical protein